MEKSKKTISLTSKPLKKLKTHQESSFISSTTNLSQKREFRLKEKLATCDDELIPRFNRGIDKISCNKMNSITRDESEPTNVYNKKNKLIRRKDIVEILKNLDVKIEKSDLDLPLFRVALTHMSYSKKNFVFIDSNEKDEKKIVIVKENNDGCVDLQDDSNQRLEFLGDAVLHLILGEYLFDRYPTAGEGFMTKLRINLEKGETVAKLAQSLGLDQFILISDPVEQAGGRTNCKIMEDAFEAFLGALYKNFGFKICKKFIIHMLEKRLNIAQFITIDTNFKDQLLRYFHQKHWGDPIYQELKHDFNQQTFENKFKVCVKDVKDKIYGIGDGINKKKAEQFAAKQALISLSVIEDDNDDE